MQSWPGHYRHACWSMLIFHCYFLVIQQHKKSEVIYFGPDTCTDHFWLELWTRRLATTKTVCAHVGGPKIWGTLGYHLLERGYGWCSRNMLFPYICYHTKFRHSRSNRLGVGRGPKTVGAGACPFGMDRGWPLETRSFLICVTTPDFVAVGWTIWT